MRNCPYCGVTLNETTHGRWYCPNHGIVEGELESKSEEKSNSSYIG